MRAVRARVIPLLLLKGARLVKTVKFANPKYVGDPRNAVKIFNDKEVDELALLDITATQERRSPDFELIQEIVSEAFMPVAYGGGIRSVDDARTVIALGVEKVIVNTAAVEKPGVISQLANRLGSQSVVVSIDARRGTRGRYEVVTRSASNRTNLNPVQFAAQATKSGAGELLLQSVDQDGTMAGYDLDLIRAVTSVVGVPVIAAGGAGSLEDLEAAVRIGGASAAAAGSLFVFRGRHRSVMISYPDSNRLEELFSHG
jgi:cyclase